VVKIVVVFAFKKYFGNFLIYFCFKLIVFMILDHFIDILMLK